MKLIQNPSLTTRLRQLVQTQGPLTLHVSEGVQPVVLMDDLTQEVQQFREAAGTGQAPAAAGFVPEVCLANPAGSGILVLLDRVWIATGTAQNVDIGPHVGPTTAGLWKGWRDQRLTIPTAAATQPVATVGAQSTQAAVPWGARYFRWYCAATTEYEFGNLQMVLRPGTGVELSGVTANSNLTVDFDWRERELLPQEQ